MARWPALLSICAMLALNGCLGAEKQETIDIPVAIDSIPEGCVVEYRAKLVRHDDRLIPKRPEWRYLGKTPIKDKLTVDREITKQPLSSIEFRVKLKDHDTIVKEVSQPEIDWNDGIVFRAAPRFRDLPEE